MDSDIGVAEACAGRLIALRSHAGWRLVDLAERTGISVSTLSRFETGLRLPRLDQAVALAAAYGVTLDALAGWPVTGDPKLNLRPRTGRDGSGVVSLVNRPCGIQGFKFVLPAVGDPDLSELRTHRGYLWVYVLNGTLSLVMGKTSLLLAPGESAEFDTRTPHRLASAGDGPAEVLVLMGPQGERVRRRVGPRDTTATHDDPMLR